MIRSSRPFRCLDLQPVTIYFGLLKCWNQKDFCFFLWDITKFGGSLPPVPVLKILFLYPNNATLGLNKHKNV